MLQGQCVFSGFAVPRGSGINTVGNDGKTSLTRSGKERSLIKLKISSRDCNWTQSSRAFHKKTNKSVKEQNSFIPITKIVRGFTLIPKALVAEEPVKKTVKKDEIKKTEKVNLKSNNLKANLNNKF
jgi:ribosomal protein L24E